MKSRVKRGRISRVTKKTRSERRNCNREDADVRMRYGAGSGRSVRRAKNKANSVRRR